MPIKEEWNKLPKWGKIAVGVGAAGAVFLYIRSSTSPAQPGPGQVDQQNPAPAGGGSMPQVSDFAGQLSGMLADQQAQNQNFFQGVADVLAGQKQEFQSQFEGIKASQESNAAQIASLGGKLADLTNIKAGVSGEQIPANPADNGTVHESFLNVPAFTDVNQSGAYAKQLNIIEKIKKNAAAYNNTNSDSVRTALHNANMQLGESIGAKYDSGSGEWKLNGQVIN